MGNDDKSRQENKQRLLRIGLGVGVLVVVLIVYIFFADWPISSNRLAAKYGDAVYLCRDVMALLPVPLSERKPVDEIRRLVFVEVDDETEILTLHDWRQQLPPAWAADGADELDAIVCLRFSTLRLESCDYTVTDDPFTISTTIFRLRQRLEIAIIDAASGRLVRYDEITGGDPGPCPDALPSGNLQGLDIPYEEVEASILPYIVPAD